MTKAAPERSPAENNEAIDDPNDDQGRASGSQPATRYEPMPIGGDAFATPLAPAGGSSDAPGALRTHAVWLIVGAAAGVAAGALGLALILKPARVGATHAPAPAFRLEQPSRAALIAPSPARSASEAGDERQALADAPPRPAAKPAAAEPAVGAADQTGATPSTADDSAQQTERAPGQGSSVVHASSERQHARPQSHRLPQQPDRAQVIAAMAAVRPAVQACFGAAHGTATANVRILGSSGRVSTARVTGQAGGIGSCIARAVRQARFPKFAMQALTISYPFGR